jgi:hypothetical protein
VQINVPRRQIAALQIEVLRLIRRRRGCGMNRGYLCVFDRDGTTFEKTIRQDDGAARKMHSGHALENL